MYSVTNPELMDVMCQAIIAGHVCPGQAWLVSKFDPCVMLLQRDGNGHGRNLWEGCVWTPAPRQILKFS